MKMEINTTKIIQVLNHQHNGSIILAQLIQSMYGNGLFSLAQLYRLDPENLDLALSIINPNNKISDEDGGKLLTLANKITE